ncbi:MFS family permease [Spinactinospora alkalitolerans]|uniref:MFS family permease n=1 Tax=Spinactinospora alkalitolerans TaxID=687207 RepID=A0A852TTL2_9ACTN|nr:DUF2157 domain-containing protein [Spinactinospora alkalitolerans]NYE47001.1 MFS family permease [Spinactinospora alkalitolerans]
MAGDAGPDDAREEALRGLVEQGVLSGAQAAAVREALDAAEPERSGVRWIEVVGYLGGGLVLAGAVVLVGASWDELTRTLKVVLLAAVTAAAIAAGVLTAGGVRDVAGSRRHRVPAVRRRIAGALFALAAATAAFAVGVALDDHTVLASAATGLLVAALGYAALPTVLGLLTCAVLSVIAVLAAVEKIPDEPEPAWALALIALGLVWGALAVAGLLAPRALGLGAGATIALLGAQQPFYGGGVDVAWGYTLTLAVAVGCLVLYQRERAWVLLVAGVAGVTLAVPEAVWDWTDGAIGGAAALLLAGAILILASGIGVRAHRRRSPEAPRRS